MSPALSFTTGLLGYHTYLQTRKCPCAIVTFLHLAMHRQTGFSLLSFYSCLNI